jgi:transcription-repair coupling factor (superfamily II helicase)
MNQITSDLKSNLKYVEILKNIDLNNDSKISLSGMTDSMKAFLIDSLTKDTNKNSVIICSNNFQANKLIQDLNFFDSLETIYFPARNIKYYDITAESKEIENTRMYAIKKILQGGKHIVVTTIDSLQTKMFSKEIYNKKSLKISVNNKIEIQDLVEKFVDLGYERSESVEGKGQFAVRGGIIDIFSIENDVPFRIEMFGNEIDNIRSFDVLTQRSIDTIKSFEVSVISEDLVSKDKLEKTISKLNEYISNNNLSEELKKNIEKDIEKFREMSLENLVDKYFEIFESKPTNFLEYVKEYNIFVDEPSKCIERATNACEENMETLKVLHNRKYMNADFANKYLNFNEIEDLLNTFNTVYLEKINMDASLNKNRKEINLDVKEACFYKNSMDVLIQDINRYKDKTIVLVYPTVLRIEQIKNYLLDNKIRAEYIDNIVSVESLKKGQVYITKGILSGGFVSDDFEMFLLAEPVTGAFSKTRKIKKMDKNHQTINSYDDLEIGDYVVHENHGIGVYKGIETINVQSVQKDYIKIEYSHNGVLYVPINQLDSVRKYVCDDDTVPKMNSLGSKEWEKTKHKVITHVKEIAKDLMILYAKREKTRGFAFSKDTPWQKEFEESFEYELTDDQRVSVEEIKEDMEDFKPMDRLLCGDVGYGKTEVALRVAFKAVMDKKQVAYLVPTTVLSLQQFRTFKSRMENFGIRVEMLSRFKSKKEQTQILKDLVDGKIDIIVGTHRLLSKDVFFKDLGLLIIDEEHRFGVKAKESIKVLKETVDVLSMTATPIPRTLHMSMIGIRQMSTLTEPPIERLPVHTYVLEYEQNVVKDAIEKELLRDGQVFYINNRVNNIEEISNKVRSIVPDARIAFAHGQMDPHQIEDVMIRFINHELDVLVCTTILESGIDIPNANTIIIENADKLGLAQLYQIRGRVGRSSRVSYAYVTYEKNKQISEVSEKRLKAIRDFTEFGSGFKIALRDLEIRGAGNMLGREQHGHMANVGYELYLALLEKAIKEEKEGIKDDSIIEIQKEVKIDLNVSAYISDGYIKNPIQKIAMYQKISDIESKEQSLDVIDELLDRYGDIPKETENLIKIVEIRNAARRLGITRILQTENLIKFEPSNLKIPLTNINNNDILIHVQLEIEKLEKLFKEEKGK